MGLVMALVHECGHVVVGVLQGGKLTYLEVVYLQLYPRLAVDMCQGYLGLTAVEGLSGSAFGLMLLAGSLSTHLVAWGSGLIMLKRKWPALKFLWLLGVFDLPAYTALPQIGLRHFAFLGGTQPEPLLGARALGIADSTFYLTVVLSTLGLVFLYLKTCALRDERREGSQVERKKHIKLKSVSFEFFSLQPFEPIALEFINVLEKFKSRIEPHLKLLNLPRKVYVAFVSNGFGLEVAGKWTLKNLNNFIHISVGRLHDIEISCETTAESYLQYIYLFLHELAHFKTDDEQKADQIARSILQNMFEEMKG